DSTLVMSVPNAVSYKTLREFLTGMPPWTYWFFHPDLSHESRHCFEYTPLVFKVLLFSSGFEENVFTTIFAYSDIENESDIIKISESLSLNTETFGDTMIAQAKKTPFGPPIRYPDVLYNAEDYYQSTYPTLYPILETRVRSFIETRGQCLQHAKRVSFLETELQKLGEQLDQFQQAIVENDTLRAQIDELLFICDCYLQKQTKQTQDLRSAQEQAAKAALDLDQAQRESEALVAKLNEIRTSTSWILTSPLRALLGHFPKASLLAGRLLRWGWWTLTFQLPKKLRERQVVRAEKIGHGLRR
ncbi:MAG: hypothetical protein LJE70_17205, partial [Chromatiaceae bacterium]|nr:hypothetical protein [Chromatiaceae bacterium]